jgi:hypothetical protein
MVWIVEGHTLAALRIVHGRLEIWRDLPTWQAKHITVWKVPSQACVVACCVECIIPYVCHRRLSGSVKHVTESVREKSSIDGSSVKVFQIEPVSAAVLPVLPPARICLYQDRYMLRASGYCTMSLYLACGDKSPIVIARRCTVAGIYTCQPVLHSESCVEPLVVFPLPLAFC